MIKKDVWRGIPEEKISSLSIEEFVKLIPARERRTVLRAVSGKNKRFKQLIDKVRKLKAQGKANKVIRTHVRSAVILPEWLGLTFGVHNGKEFKKVEITLHRIGKRLGDFSHTTGRVVHSGPGVGATRGSKFVPLK